MEVPGKSPQNAYYTMSDPVGFDADGNGLIDVIYAGDSEGILWKFYYDFATRAWRKNARFATGGQPITGRPTLAPDRLGNLRVYFGTGRSLVDLDRQDTSRNAFYCLIEKRRKLPRKGVADPNAGRFTWAPAVSDGPDDLLDVTTLRSAQDIEGLGEEERSTLEETGWFFDLGATGEQPAERVTTRAQVLAGVVFFTSFTPSEDPCSFGGDSRLYAISWDSGLQARFDLEETVLKTENGGNLPQGKRYGELGSAEAAGLCWDGGSARGSAESRLLLQSGDGALETRRIRLPERRMSLLGWREIDH
jgi:type IV pilus assembly protein PilY1